MIKALRHFGQGVAEDLDDVMAGNDAGRRDKTQSNAGGWLEIESN